MEKIKYMYLWKEWLKSDGDTEYYTGHPLGKDIKRQSNFKVDIYEQINERSGSKRMWLGRSASLMVWDP